MKNMDLETLAGEAFIEFFVAKDPDGNDEFQRLREVSIQIGRAGKWLQLPNLVNFKDAYGRSVADFLDIETLMSLLAEQKEEERKEAERTRAEDEYHERRLRG